MRDSGQVNPIVERKARSLLGIVHQPEMIPGRPGSLDRRTFEDELQPIK